MNVNNTAFMSELEEAPEASSLSGLTKDSFPSIQGELHEDISDITFRVTARKGEVEEDVGRHLQIDTLHDNFDNIVYTLKEQGYTRIRFGVDGLEITYPLTQNDASRLLMINEKGGVPIPLYYADGRYDMVVNHSDVGVDIATVRIVLRNPMLFTSQDELNKRIAHLNKIAAYDLDLTEDIDKPRFSFVSKAN